MFCKYKIDSPEFGPNLLVLPVFIREWPHYNLMAGFTILSDLHIYKQDWDLSLVF